MTLRHGQVQTRPPSLPPTCSWSLPSFVRVCTVESSEIRVRLELMARGLKQTCIPTNKRKKSLHQSFHVHSRIRLLAVVSACVHWKCLDVSLRQTDLLCQKEFDKLLTANSSFQSERVWKSAWKHHMGLLTRSNHRSPADADFTLTLAVVAAGLRMFFLLRFKKSTAKTWGAHAPHLATLWILHGDGFHWASTFWHTSEESEQLEKVFTCFATCMRTKIKNTTGVFYNHPACFQDNIFMSATTLPTPELCNRLATASSCVAREDVTVKLPPETSKGQNRYQVPLVYGKGHYSLLVPSHKLNPGTLKNSL